MHIPPQAVGQAAIHGRSMEDEARDILRSVLNQEPQGSNGPSRHQRRLGADKISPRAARHDLV